ncbi:MAG: ATP-binding protein, partial [Campylobacterota bacterium]|nr:ATP-binding protein [Campylobacterota bacterium]
MNKDGLKKIYLIKSAGYEFAEINLENNTLLLGESGVGKTTIMRAVLFFYTMDYSDSLLNLNSDTKKSFNDWYFREYNSHIVYEYTKDDNIFLFVVSKSGKLHYTFIDITNSTLGVKEIFINEKKPVNFEKLNENIQKTNLINYTTTIKDKYINLFHKRDEFGKKIKNDAQVDFALFENIRSRKEFAKTLSNIFASSSVKSSSIKKTIVSLIDNSSAKIALNDIKINLNKFATEKKEIERFENKIPTIEKLSDEFESYRHNKQEFKKFANEIEYLKKNSILKAQKLDAKLEENTTKKVDLEQTYRVEFSIDNKNKEDKKSEIDIKKAKLNDLIKTDRKYQQSNITNLLQEYKNEKNYKDEFLGVSSRYDALTSGLNEIESKYKNLFLELQQNYNSSILDIEKDSSKSIEDKKEKIHNLIQSKDTKIKNSSSKYIGEKNILDSKEKNLNSDLIKIKEGLAKAEFFPFNKENIVRYEDNTRRYERELLTVESSLKSNSLDIKQIEYEIENIKIILTNDLSSLNDRVIKEKDLLYIQKQDIEKKLDFDSENLYGYLNKNNVKNKEKIVTYLKDDILFSNKKFN